jgi:hypothetical protein
MTEKMGGAEGTQMDVDFMDMERVNIAAIMSCCSAGWKMYRYTCINSLEYYFYELEFHSDMHQQNGCKLM